MRVSSGADDRPEVIRSAYNASPGRVDFYIEQIFGGNSQERKDESSSSDGGVGSTSFIVLLSTNSFIRWKPSYQIYEREIFQKFPPSSKHLGVFDPLFSPFPCSLLPYFVVSSTWNITRRKISLSLTFYRGRFSRKKYELLIGGKSNFMLVYVTAHRYILKQRCSPLFVPRQIESGRVGSRGLCKSSRYPIHHHSHTLVFISFRFFFP